MWCWCDQGEQETAGGGGAGVVMKLRTRLDRCKADVVSASATVTKVAGVGRTRWLGW